QEQAATVTLGDLAEIAGFDVGRIPADVRNLNLKIGSTEGLVRSIETLQDMAEGEQSTASGIDAGDILRFATDVYNARYGFDFNAPPFDQFLVNEFPAVFDVANALARGEQPSEDSLRSVLGTDEAAGLAPAQ